MLSSFLSIRNAESLIRPLRPGGKDRLGLSAVGHATSPSYSTSIGSRSSRTGATTLRKLERPDSCPLH